MRYIQISIPLILLLFLPTHQFFSQSVPLNEIYTIGSGGNYVSFRAAVDSLKSNGISGPVVFNIKNGTYNEQISIPSVAGVSSTNTITFQSESNDSTKVLCSYSASSASNYTVQLTGASYITFNKISLSALNNSYGRVIEIRNGSNHNTFRNCILQGLAASSTSINLAIIYSQGNTDRYNTFENQYYRAIASTNCKL